MFITKSSIWPLISLLLHLLSAQSLKSRFVSWIPTLANSDGCLLVKHPPLCTCLLPCAILSLWDTSITLSGSLIPRLTCIMIYGWWAFWILCSHWRYPPFFLLHPTPLSRPLHVLSIARESNSSSYSLIACSYPCPDWLACFIKQKIRRERNKCENILTTNCKLHTFSLLFSFVSWWIVSFDENWVTLTRRRLSCPFQSLAEDGCLGNNLCLVGLFPFPFSYSLTISVTQWPEWA